VLKLLQHHDLYDALELLGIVNEGDKNMAGMLQIITYLLAFYLIMKAVGILQIALASGLDTKVGVVTLGVLSPIACIVVAVAIVTLQEQQARSLSQAMSNGPRFSP
jgi:hypothetical protein